MDEPIRPGSEPEKEESPTDPEPGRSRSTGYHIRIKGHVVDRWVDKYEGLSVTLEETGDTILDAPVMDQAALHGLLRQLRDLGMPLISINPARPDLAETKREK